MVRPKLNRKVCVVINSRANYARIKSFLLAVKKSKKLKLIIILGASSILERFGNLEKIVKKDGLLVSHKIYSIVEGNNHVAMAKSVGLGILEISNIFENINPDMVVTVADRFETLSTAVAASYMNIPLIHTQGGEITGSIDESVRHAITKLSHIHFASSKKSMNNIIKMGEDKKFIFNTGCPSIDLAKKVMLKNNKINLKNIFKKYRGIENHHIDFKNYIVVVQHPVTSEYNKIHSQVKVLFEAIRKIKVSVIWLWPNIDAGNDLISKQLRKYNTNLKNLKINFYKNFEPEDFLGILIKSKCLVGNSSVGIRECSYLGVPVVNIGTRQNKRERGVNVIDSSFESMEIFSKIKKQINKKNLKKNKTYGNGDAGVKMCKILEDIELTNIQKKLCYK